MKRQQQAILLPGDLPSPANPPSACRFHTRCPYIQPTRCTEDVPPLRKLSDGHLVACHWAEEIKAGRFQPQEREATVTEQLRRRSRRRRSSSAALDLKPRGRSTKIGAHARKGELAWQP